MTGRLEYIGDELGLIKEHSESVWTRLEDMKQELGSLDGSINRIESVMEKKMLPMLERIAVALEAIAAGKS